MTTRCPRGRWSSSTTTSTTAARAGSCATARGQGDKRHGGVQGGPRQKTSALNPLGLFLRTTPHTVYHMRISGCLPVRVSPLPERTAFVPGAEAVEGDGAIPWRPMLKFQFMRTQDPPPPAAAPPDALQVQLTGWPKRWASFKTLIGILIISSQAAGLT